MAKLKPKDKDKKNTAEEGIPQYIAHLGPSLFLKGEISGDEDMIIEGKFQGKIDLENYNVLIAKGAEVEADIRVKNITINGTVKGNIYASGKVFISKEGEMKGDLNAPNISIMEGAQFKGGVKMEKEAKEVSPPEEKPETLPSEEEESKDKTSFELV